MNSQVIPVAQNNALNNTGAGVIVSYSCSYNDKVEQFLADKKAKDTTRKTYRSVLRSFKEWVDNTGRDVNTLDRKDIVAYMEHLETTRPKRQIGVTPFHCANTENLYLSCLKKFYAWLESEGTYRNIAHGVDRVAKDNTFKMHLTREDAISLLDYFKNIPLPTRTLKSGETVPAFHDEEFQRVKARNYALVNLMLRTGLRTMEVGRIRIKDITTIRGRRVVLVFGKGRTEVSDADFVILSDKAYAPIGEYLELRGACRPTDPLFAAEGYGYDGRAISTRTVQNVVKEGMRAIGLSETFTPHCLRHTTGVLLIENGCSLYEVQSILRHKDPKVTEIYLKSIEKENRYKNAPDLAIDNAFD